MTSDADMISVRSASGTNFDRMFLTMMISQNSGAIEMAKTEKDDGKSPDAAALARKAESAQIVDMNTCSSRSAAVPRSFTRVLQGDR